MKEQESDKELISTLNKLSERLLVLNHNGVRPSKQTRLEINAFKAAVCDCLGELSRETRELNSKVGKLLARFEKDSGK